MALVVPYRIHCILAPGPQMGRFPLGGIQSRYLPVGSRAKSSRAELQSACLEADTEKPPIVKSAALPTGFDVSR